MQLNLPVCLIVVLTGCLVAAILVPAGGQDPFEVGTSTDQSDESDVLGVPGRYPSYSGKFNAFIDANVGAAQRYSFGEYVDPSDPTRLIIYNGLFSSIWDAFDDNFTEAFEFSASFDIVAVQAKTRDHYYVAGRDGSTDVIERWKKGNASPLGGSQYVMKRTSLYRGNLGGIQAIGVDHAARFLLVLHGDTQRAVSQMALPGGGQLTTVCSSVQIPELAGGDYSMFPRMHPTEGVLWTLEDSKVINQENYIMLSDYQDDGVIDGWLSYSVDDYSDVYGYGSEVWTDWFMSD